MVCTLLLSACGVRNHHGFVDEDARFANYTFLGNDGTTGLAYYADETNPDEIAVGVGTCTAQDIIVTTYNDKPVTSVFPSGFLNCNTIKTITLPNTITSFGTDAFAGSSLQSITIPNGLTVISSGAFRNCKELVVVDFDKDLNSVTTINDYAFANDFKLSSFPFHNLSHLTSIGKEAFLYCLGLRSVIFPDSFVSLESYAFQDCKGLTTIYFSDNIAFIGEYAFKGVGESAKIYFSESRVKTVSDLNLSDPNDPLPFEDAHNFSFGNYHVPIIFEVGKLIVSGPFHFLRPDTGTYALNEYRSDSNGNWTDTGKTKFLENIAEDEIILWNYEDDGITTELDIPSTVDWGDTLKVVGIKNNVFKDKDKLTSVTFHENLRFIDAFAFSGCTKLTNIDLKGAVDLKHIQCRAFYDTMPHNNVREVSRMYKMHIPANVENIAADAFRSCDGLFKLYFDGASSECEETFFSAGNTDSFELPYEPTAVTSVTVDGPEKAFTRNGKTITISGGENVRKGAVIKVKYTTNSTTTQEFVGHKEGVDLVSEFILSGKAEAIGSLTINGVAQVQDTDYTLTIIGTDPNEKTKITFAVAPDEGDAIVVSYRSLSKLTKIDECAFYECANGYGGATFHSCGQYLRQTFNPFQTVYFPASLDSIGEYAFSKSEIAGGTIFKSSSLTIKNHAFAEHKCLSSIVFPTDMTNLNLYEKCFASGLGTEDCSAGNVYKKLFSVTLPQNTTVWGTNIFDGHIFLSIYCIKAEPTIKNNNWHKLGGNISNAFGDFGTAPTTIDWAPVYVVNSVDDIVSLPSKEHPIFSFVKEIGASSATLTNFHYYGGRIEDNSGNSAIKPGSALNGYNSNNINENYSSEYAEMLSNGHFRGVVPIQVKINGSFLDVKTIGQRALAIQCNESNMNPKKSSRNYWLEGSNYYSMREIILPDTIETIAGGAMAFAPYTSVKTYESSHSTTSADGLSKIWDGDGSAIPEDGTFPSNLKTLGHIACSYSGLVHAKLPNGLTSFSGITESSGPSGTSYQSFPFLGCFDLEELDLYDVGETSPIFSSNGSIISYASSGQMIEGAEGITNMEIPWGTTSICTGALRGGRKIQTLDFPYTITNVASFFIDTIGSSTDSQGWNSKGSLEKVRFKNAAEFSQDDTQKSTYATPRCTAIGEVAFWGSKTLKEIEFPVSLQTIGREAFEQCEGITDMSVDNGTSAVSPYAANPNTPLGTHLDLTKLPSLSSIGFEAFRDCKSLTALTTSSSITALANNTFNGCNKMATVTINSNTKTIGQSCFSGCTKLDTVTFQGTGVTFNNSAFSNCDSLKTISIPNDSKLGNSVFNSCDGLDDNAASGGGVIVGTGVTFNGQTSNSAFSNCPSGTKIYLMESAATYDNSSNRYKVGWNYYSSTETLNFYCYSYDEPTTSSQNYGFWHMVSGVPTIW